MGDNEHIDGQREDTLIQNNGSSGSCELKQNERHQIVPEIEEAKSEKHKMSHLSTSNKNETKITQSKEQKALMAATDPQPSEVQ